MTVANPGSSFRYLVVARSFSAATITIKRTYFFISCAYLLSLFWTLMPLFGWSTYDYEVGNDTSDQLTSVRDIGYRCLVCHQMGRSLVQRRQLQHHYSDLRLPHSGYYYLHRQRLRVSRRKYRMCSSESNIVVTLLPDSRTATLHKHGREPVSRTSTTAH